MSSIINMEMQLCKYGGAAMHDPLETLGIWTTHASESNMRFPFLDSIALWMLHCVCHDGYIDRPCQNTWGKLEHVLPITQEQRQWQRVSKVEAQAVSMSVIYVGRWGNGKQAFPSTAVWVAGFRPAEASSFAWRRLCLWVALALLLVLLCFFLSLPNKLCTSHRHEMNLHRVATASYISGSIRGTKQLPYLCVWQFWRWCLRVESMSGNYLWILKLLYLQWMRIFFLGDVTSRLAFISDPNCLNIFSLTFCSHER